MKFSEMEYKRPDLPQVEKDYNELLTSFDRATTAEEQKQILARVNDLKNHRVELYMISLLFYNQVSHIYIE